ncbi:MAG: winged helix-turn-helix domain-containing protein [Methanomassiliicoccales archaeon]
MKAIERLLWWLIAGSVGGINRGRIINILKDRPYNANQLTEQLDLDYKTVRHHLEMLEKNGLIIPIGDGYGKMYGLSPLLEENLPVFEEIWVRIGKKNKTGSGDMGG